MILAAPISNHDKPATLRNGQERLHAPQRITKRKFGTKMNLPIGVCSKCREPKNLRKFSGRFSIGGHTIRGWRERTDFCFSRMNRVRLLTVGGKSSTASRQNKKQETSRAKRKPISGKPLSFIAVCFPPRTTKLNQTLPDSTIFWVFLMMWLTTKRKRTDGEPSRRDAGDSTSDPAQGSDWESTLPLDWTQMGHSRKRTRLGSDGDDVGETTTFEGRAIFCLHDNDDPGWIQGYFIPKGSTKPWGMLAVREEVDDCMACCEGGYRRLTLTIYHRGQDKQSSLQNETKFVQNTNGGKKDMKRSNSCKISGVEWTGGDMIALYHKESVDMQAEILLTVSDASVQVSEFRCFSQFSILLTIWCHLSIFLKKGQNGSPSITQILSWIDRSFRKGI